MTLNEFVNEMNKELDGFRDFWIKNHSIDPDNFPLVFPLNNTGAWMEQFLMWTESNSRELEPKWCMCTKLTGVARDGKSTCIQCRGIDAYGGSKDRPQEFQKTVCK